MDPATAYNLLDEVASKYHGTRVDHINLQNALSVIHGVLFPEPEPTTEDETVYDTGLPDPLAEPDPAEAA